MQIRYIAILVGLCFSVCLANTEESVRKRSFGFGFLGDLFKPKEIIEQCKSEPFDVYLIVDGSASVGRRNFDLGLSFLEKLVVKLPDKSTVSMLQFSDRLKWEFFNSKESLGSIADRIKKTRYMNGKATMTAMALRTASWQIAKLRKRDNVKIFVMTDGKATDWEYYLNNGGAVCRYLDSLKVETWAIGTGTGHSTKHLNKDQLEQIAGDKSRLKIVNDFEALDTHFLKSLSNQICESGIDVRKKCDVEPLNIYLVVDGSGSVGKTNYNLGLQFLEKMILEIPEQSTVSMLQFSKSMRWEFRNSKDSLAKIAKKIRSSRYMRGGGTLTARALRTVAKVIAKLTKRDNIVVLVMTDGKATDWPYYDNSGAAWANYLRTLGTKTWALGTGSGNSIAQLNMDQLLEIAGDKTRMSIVKDFSLLNDDFLTSLTTQICDKETFLKKTCPTPSTPSNGKLIASHKSGGKIPEGTTISFSCNANYYLIGDKQLTCGGTQKYDHPVPICKRICTKPKAPTYGTMSVISETSSIVERDTVKFGCNNKYAMVGESSAKCLGTGSFDNAVPLCKRICSPPESPYNGKYTKSGNVQEIIDGEVISYACNSGSTLIGHKDIVCQSNGKYNHPVPVCKKICNMPQTPANAVRSRPRNIPARLLEGDTVAYLCKPSFGMLGKGIVSCLSSGSLEQLPTCKKICRTPAAPSNGKLKIDSGSRQVLAGATVSFSCRSGYLLDGSRTITCQDSGKYDQSVPTCERICSSPTSLKNGHFTIKLGTKASEITKGGTVSYLCNTGYVMMGYNVLTCMSNGRYDRNLPVCKKTCEAPLALANGVQTRRTKTKEIIEGEIIVHSCDKGYVLVGNKAMKCQSDGRYDFQVPACKRRCQFPNAPTHGYRPISSGKTEVLEGQHVTFSCIRNYAISGFGKLTCLSTGLYDHASPICERICKPPVSITNGKYTIKDKPAEYSPIIRGDIVEYVCNSGYALVGHKDLLCRTNGVYDHSTPVCKKKCPAVQKFSNGEITKSGSLENVIEGDTISFNCDLGYRLTGKSVQTCLDTGNYDVEAPTCSKITSGTCNQPLNVYLVVDGSGSVGQKNYKLGLQFLDKLISQIPTGSTVSMLQFGHSFKWEMGNMIAPSAKASRTILQSKYMRGSSTRTAKALGIVAARINTVAKKDNMVVFVMTDGKATDWEYYLNNGPAIVKHIRSLGISTWALGTGRRNSVKYLNQRQLSEIAGDPKRLLIVKDFQLLNDILSGLNEKICKKDKIKCPKPQDADHGKFTLSTKSHNAAGELYEGDSVSYTCDSNYHLIGSDKLKCLPSGNYDQKAPVCKRICKPPSTLTNGDYTVKDKSTTYPTIIRGDIVAYSCKTGYILVGHKDLECQSNGVYDYPTPVCKRSCHNIKTIENGKISKSGTLDTVIEGDTNKFSCNLGYELSGKSLQTCMKSGEYDVKEPICVKVSSGSCDKPLNVYLIVDGSGSVGKTNYKLGLQFLDKLISKIPAKSTVSMLQFGNSFKWELYNEIAPSERASQKILKSHYLRGYSTMTAKALGLVARRIEKISNKDNVVVFVMTDGKATDWPYYFNNGPGMVKHIRSMGVATWALGTGRGNSIAYLNQQQLSEIAGDPKRMLIVRDFALLNDILTGLNEKICHKVTCPKPDSVNNGKFVYPTLQQDSTIVAQGQVITYTCNSGYHLIGNEMLKCLETGKYNKDAPVCKRICSNPSKIENGQVTPSTSHKVVIEGDRNNFMCNAGYELVGKIQQTCLSSGKYDVAAPKCIRGNCNNPLNIYLIVDGSGSVTLRNYNLGLQFLDKLISKIPAKSTVSMLQFGHNFKWEFQNQPAPTAKISNLILSSKYMRGHSTLTAKALRIATTQIIKSTKQDNIVVFVMTDGKATDWEYYNNNGPAITNYIRSKGVSTWALGTGRGNSIKHLNQPQLLQIAGDRSRMLLVKDFNLLNSILNGLSDKLCEKIVQTTQQPTSTTASTSVVTVPSTISTISTSPEITTTATTSPTTLTTIVLTASPTTNAISTTTNPTIFTTTPSDSCKDKSCGCPNLVPFCNIYSNDTEVVAPADCQLELDRHERTENSESSEENGKYGEQYEQTVSQLEKLGHSTGKSGILLSRYLRIVKSSDEYRCDLFNAQRKIRELCPKSCKLCGM